MGKKAARRMARRVLNLGNARFAMAVSCNTLLPKSFGPKTEQGLKKILVSLCITCLQTEVYPNSINLIAGLT
jgi:hypothetical protein